MPSTVLDALKTDRSARISIDREVSPTRCHGVPGLVPRLLGVGQALHQRPPFSPRQARLNMAPTEGSSWHRPGRRLWLLARRTSRAGGSARAVNGVRLQLAADDRLCLCPMHGSTRGINDDNAKLFYLQHGGRVRICAERLTSSSFVASTPSTSSTRPRWRGLADFDNKARLALKAFGERLASISGDRRRRQRGRHSRSAVLLQDLQIDSLVFTVDLRVQGWGVPGHRRHDKVWDDWLDRRHGRGLRHGLARQTVKWAWFDATGTGMRSGRGDVRLLLGLALHVACIRLTR